MELKINEEITLNEREILGVLKSASILNRKQDMAKYFKDWPIENVVTLNSESFDSSKAFFYIHDGYDDTYIVSVSDLKEFFNEIEENDSTYCHVVDVLSDYLVLTEGGFEWGDLIITAINNL